MRGRILIVEDDPATCEALEKGLGSAGFEVVARTSPDEASAVLETEDFDVVVTDLNMPGLNGLELCERITSNRPGVPVIVITAFGSLETAVAAIRTGAYDFVTKPFDLESLEIALDRAVSHRRLQEEVKRLREQASGTRSHEGLVGESPMMLRLYETIDAIAASESSILITGETGTGKELVARALHRGSSRRAGPFVPFNCSAVPEALLESELFGYRRGAFTDAKEDRTGLLVRANGGTIFLDEIGDMPLQLQPKLLRALEERRVRPLGSDSEVPFDARLLTATHRDLEACISDGTFRRDLYFRIDVIHLELPPLRARGNDTLLLAQHFLRRFASRSGKRVRGISTAAAEKLLAYDWPGNVRELANAIERAVALTRFDQVVVEDLPEKLRDYSRSAPLQIGADPQDLPPMEEVERRYILRVLELLGGNKSAAAQVLGFDRRTLYRKLERYGREDPPAGDRDILPQV